MLGCPWSILAPSTRLRINFAALVLGLAGLLSGCATATQDLERARKHYQNLEYPRALALLRVLGDDEDALSPQERVQYAFLRGMTDLKVAESLPLSHPDRGSFRACGRDWLVSALEQGARTEGSLLEEQGVRARKALAALSDLDASPGACLPIR